MSSRMASGGISLDILPDMADKKLEQMNRAISEIVEWINSEQKRMKRRDALADEIPKAEMEADRMKEKLGRLGTQRSALDARLEAEKKPLKKLAAKLRFENRRAAEKQRRELLEEAKKLRDDYDMANSRYNTILNNIKVYEGKIAAYTKGIQSSERLDIAEIKQELASVRGELDRVRLALQELAGRIRTNESVRKNIGDRSGELAALEKRHVSEKALYDTASGQVKDRNKITFEAYIQMTYFERIIKRANLRFLKMSDGQYELRRTTESDNKKSQTGLDLCVVDHYNGSYRSVRSLSGGESFMASLSLALGLSDEVQASAGGIQIDTMFVDEGFGSLDTEKTLPQAYSALVSVTEGRKLVGIISHVTELKEKIDRQIVVEKDKTGRARAELRAE